jgi:predicted polyphosphate/ATP-dependent NAD kinase
MKKLGLIINPIAGLGGSVGLKGTDGEDIVNRAIALGAKPRAGERALTALKAIAPLKDEIELYTCFGVMGYDVAKAAGFEPKLINISRKSSSNLVGDLHQTSSSDTIAAAVSMVELGVDLLLFAGGDGTARNVYSAVGDKIVVIGIPAGVKIHSAVYAINPQNAGLLATEYLRGNIQQVTDGEVMDIDEEAFRTGRVTASLYGYMKIPLNRTRLQGGKISSATDLNSVSGIAETVTRNMIEDCLYIIGPGSTTITIMKKLGLNYTLLGVDLVKNGKLIAKDVTEQEILLELDNSKCARIVVTPIGGQACLFGRGNQQISSSVIRRVGKENIIVVATKSKIHSFYGNQMLVDTGDEELDRHLCGYYRVITAYKNETVVRVGC